MEDLQIKIVNQIGKLIETLATSSFFFQNVKLSFGELRIMLYVIKSSECKMSDVTHHFNIPPSTATGIIDRLVKYKYIKRSRSNTDRRKVILTYTEDAIKLYQNHHKMRLKNTKKKFEPLSLEKKKNILDSLQQINGILNEII